MVVKLTKGSVRKNPDLVHPNTDAIPNANRESVHKTFEQKLSENDVFNAHLKDAAKAFEKVSCGPVQIANDLIQMLGVETVCEMPEPDSGPTKDEAYTGKPEGNSQFPKYDKQYGRTKSSYYGYIFENFVPCGKEVTKELEELKNTNNQYAVRQYEKVKNRRNYTLTLFKNGVKIVQQMGAVNTLDGVEAYPYEYPCAEQGSNEPKYEIDGTVEVRNAHETARPSDFAILSYRDFLALDVKTALKNGGLYSHLMATQKKEPPKKTQEPKTTEDEEEDEPEENMQARYLRGLRDMFNMKEQETGMLSEEENKFRQAVVEFLEYLGLEDPAEETEKAA
jgi:hypothetical protein